MSPRDNPDPDLARAAGRFVESFRHVFHYDCVHPRLPAGLSAVQRWQRDVLTPGLDNDREASNSGRPWRFPGPAATVRWLNCSATRLHPDQLEEELADEDEKGGISG